jgi:hypothetical protein
MSDPRNAAHDKKVSQEKKHHPVATAVLAPGEVAAVAEVADETPAPKPDATLEGSLTVLAQLKDLEFHSRAHLERLAELTLTVDDELKQKELNAPLSEVYSAQNAVQTKLTTLIEAYKAECDRMQA